MCSKAEQNSEIIIVPIMLETLTSGGGSSSVATNIRPFWWFLVEDPLRKVVFLSLVSNPCRLDDFEVKSWVLLVISLQCWRGESEGKDSILRRVLTRNTWSQGYGCGNYVKLAVRIESHRCEVVVYIGGERCMLQPTCNLNFRLLVSWLTLTKYILLTPSHILLSITSIVLLLRA